MSSYVMVTCIRPASLRVSMQGLTPQSTMEAELVAEPLTANTALYCADITGELGLKETFECVPISTTTDRLYM